MAPDNKDRYPDRTDGPSGGSRISAIPTLWSIFQQAHGSTGPISQHAMGVLAERYRGAVYRYLLAALRNPDDADEVYQEFALRLVGGRLGGADPAKGRFRDYLRRTLINLINDHRARRRKEGVQFAENAPELAAEDEGQPDPFLASWRDELFQKAWDELRERESRGGPRHYTALRLRSEDPAARYADLAARLTAALSPETPIGEAAARKLVERARRAFTDALLGELATSLRTRDWDAIEEEVVALELPSHLREAVRKRRRAEAQHEEQ